MAYIDAFLKLMKEMDASDLHILVGSPPLVRVHGDITPLRFRALSPFETQKFIYEILSERQIKEFEEVHDLDLGYSIPDVARFRVNVFLQRRGIGAVFRLIPYEIVSIEDLMLPKVLYEFVKYDKGLILCTGPTGCGKSTTLAAIIDVINTRYRKHIVTVEDPIEFVHTNKKSIISQKEIGTHISTFAEGVALAQKESADVLLIGELRDLETIKSALSAVDAGMLVFATLHTNSASATVDRLIDVFPSEHQHQIRTMLSLSLKAVVSQQLLKRADKKGRVAAVEVMITNSAIANLIRENKTHQILSVIQAFSQIGMQSMDQDLLNLVQKGIISKETALEKAENKALFDERYAVEAPIEEKPKEEEEKIKEIIVPE